MHAVLIVMGIGWIVFWAGWLIAAFTAKASRGPWSRIAVARIALVVVLFYVVRQYGHGNGHLALAGPVAEVIGLVLWVAGLGLAVWARLYIGRNWGMPMTRREHPDLVTTGPYRFIRHPIYSGMLLALIGTAVATTLFALIIVAVIGGFFVFSASREERFLAQEFPDSYPDYQAGTKMLIPFMF
ncbi:MAG TPA: isoprenylcysteine carboxylmethyltransferase family protein [Trebonia sp.]